ncbi:MAG: DUF3397 family protein [Lactobacillus sp.]|nr:DUF3397 family protein [Lactobacillus sp.]
MTLVFGWIILGLIVTFILGKFFPKAQFKKYDLLPIFMILAVHTFCQVTKITPFLPFGLFFYILGAIFLIIWASFQQKNISLKATLRMLWDLLTLTSIVWIIGLFIINI